MRDDDGEDTPTTIYKVVNGEKDYNNYIEFTDDDTITLCVEDEFLTADLLYFNMDEDSKDIDIECEYHEQGIHIHGEFILGQDMDDIESIIHTSSYELDDDDWEESDYAEEIDNNEITILDMDDVDQDDEWDDDLMDDDVDRRDIPCQIKGIETDCPLQTFVKEIKKKGFTFDFKYEQKNSAYENQVFQGIFAKRKCELTIFPVDYNRIRSIDIDFAKTCNINQAIRDYHDIVNAFSQKYGCHSSKDDDKLADIETLLKNSEDFASLANTSFDFVDNVGDLTNSIDITIYSDNRDHENNRVSWVTISFMNFYHDEQYLDI